MKSEHQGQGEDLIGRQKKKQESSEITLLLGFSAVLEAMILLFKILGENDFQSRILSSARSSLRVRVEIYSDRQSSISYAPCLETLLKYIYIYF